MMPGTFYSESEFDGVGGACGPNSLAMAQCWGLQRYIGKPEAGQTATSVLYARMRANRLCDPSGVSTNTDILRQAIADRFKAEQWGGGGWLAYLKAGFAATAVSVFLFDRAHFLRDYLTGAGEDAGPDLGGHFILGCEYHPGGLSARAGRVLPEGVFCADGDSDVNNPIVGGHRQRRRGDHRLCFYPIPVLAAANPVALIRVYPQVSFGPVYTEPGGLPGWRDTAGADPANFDGVLYAPSGFQVVRGFRAYVLAEARAGHWDAHNSPIENERAVGEVEQWNTAHGFGSIQTFHTCRLVYTPREGVYQMWLGDETLYLERQLAKLAPAA